jgi:hypothetical protein
MTVPAETTWLDLVTLAIAGLGFSVAVVSLLLGIRRDRRESRTTLRLEVLVGAGVLLLHVTNVAQRRVTAQRTGFAKSKRDGRDMAFIGWLSANARPSKGRRLGEPAFPETLEAGEPTYEAYALPHIVKGLHFPEVPAWAWCEDERGNAYWTRLPESVRDAIRSTKRRIPGPNDEYGQPAQIEIDDEAG